jgi:CBS domain-containing protein
MAQHGVLSVPVQEVKTGTWLGLLDWRDVDAALFISGKTDKSVATATAESVVGLCEKNPLYTVRASGPLLHALEFFGKGIHRVVLENDFDSGLPFIGVLSQSDALRYVAEVIRSGTGSADLDPILGVSVEAADVFNTSPLSISCSATVQDAITLLYESQVSSIAVTDDSLPGSVLYGSFSTSDLKYLFHRSRISKLDLSEQVGLFINRVRQEQGIENLGKDRAPYFSVSKACTVRNAILKMSATKTHRLWVESDPLARDLCGVISISDILRYLTPSTSLHFWHRHFVPSTSSARLP